MLPSFSVDMKMGVCKERPNFGITYYKNSDGSCWWNITNWIMVEPEE